MIERLAALHGPAVYQRLDFLPDRDE